MIKKINELTKELTLADIPDNTTNIDAIPPLLRIKAKANDLILRYIMQHGFQPPVQGLDVSLPEGEVQPIGRIRV
ncbi:hypothetical protein RYX45_24820, partial [Alkalihalophilus pseudofirmus]